MYPQTNYGTMPPQPDVWFEQLNPSVEYADFSYDAGPLLSTGDTIIGLSMMAMPSGSGEAVLSRLQISPNAAGVNALISVWITGGVSGRTYIYQLNVTTYLTRVLTVFIGQTANPLLATCPVPPPPNPGFGTAITWP